MKRYLTFIILGLLILGLIAAVVFFDLFKSKGKIPNLGEDKDYNLLVITVDCLRADGIGVYSSGAGRSRTPNIDRLSKKGVFFKNCYASVPQVLPTHCTLFTGKEPIAHGVRNDGKLSLNTREITLAEMMKAGEFQTYAVVASSLLLTKFGLSQGFDGYDDSLGITGSAGNLKAEAPADNVYARFNQWLDTNHSQRFFAWVHFHDPHAPYNPPQKYKERFEKDPYSAEINFVDDYVGKIVNALEEKKIRDKTLIILAGGHGEAFGEHQETGHGIFCYEESLRVPLLFSNPVLFEEERQCSRRVRLTDIMPTVLHLFNLETPPGVQGKSAVPFIFITGDEKEKTPAEEKERAVYFESMLGNEEFNWAPLRGLIEDNYKYISLPEPELYDLKEDPRERKNLYQEKKELAKSLEKRLQDMISTFAGPGSSPLAIEPGALDPKKGIEILNQLREVNRQIENGDTAAAEKTLNRLREENPGAEMPAYYDFLYQIYQAKGERRRAEEILKKGLEKFPDTDRFKMNLALARFNAGKIDEAEGLCREILKSEPKNTRAYLLLAKIYKARGKIYEALSYYEKALKLEPKNISLKIEYAEVLSAMGRKSSALDIVNELLKEENGLHKEIKVSAGFLLLNLGEYDRVITLCLEINSDEATAGDPRVWNQLGMAYFKKGNPQEAIKAYKKALDLDPKNALTLSNMGTFYLALFRLKKDKDFHTWAVEHYTRAVEADPRMVTALNGLAVAYSFAGNPNKAIAYWEKVLAVNPGFTQVYFNLGITYLKMGKKKKALDYLNRCKKNYYPNLSVAEQRQLDRLIMEAGK